jgi:RNA polymerase sigma-70 factor (family 1)
MDDSNNSNLQRFRLLYDTFYDKLYMFVARRTHSSEEAKDIVQEVFLKLLEKLDDFTAQTNVEAIVFTMARNLIVDNYRRKIVSENHLPRITEIYNADNPLEETLDSKASPNPRLDSIKAAVESLPEQRKAIFKLSKYNGLTSEEIAEQLSLSKRTVENQLYRAIKSLRKTLSHLFFSIF